MQTKEPVIHEKWGIGPGPVLFTGEPASCQGFVELINHSAEHVEPKAIALTNFELGLEQRRPPRAAIVSARLGPHERLWVPVELSLDPATPPGSYEGQLACGDQRENVVINILESPDLRITPPRVTITAGADETVALRILVANLGNSEFLLPTPMSIHLEHDLELERYFGVALKAAGMQGFEKFLDRFVQELASGAVGAATLEFKPEGARFRAGETKPVELQVHLPDDLQTSRVYKCVVKLRNARLMLNVRCVEARKASRRKR